MLCASEVRLSARARAMMALKAMPKQTALVSCVETSMCCASNCFAFLNQRSMRACLWDVARTQPARTFPHPPSTALVLACPASKETRTPHAVVCQSLCLLRNHDWRTDFDVFRPEFNACTAEPCGPRAVCTDLPPPSRSRTCACPAGFTGDPEFDCEGMFCVAVAHLHSSVFFCSSFTQRWMLA